MFQIQIWIIIIIYQPHPHLDHRHHRPGKIPNDGEEDNGDDIDGAGKGSNLFYKIYMRIL